MHRVPPRGARTGVRKWLMIPFALKKILSLRREFDLIYCPGYQGIGIAGILAGALVRRPVVLRSGNLGVLTGDSGMRRSRAGTFRPILGSCGG